MCLWLSPLTKTIANCLQAWVQRLTRRYVEPTAWLARFLEPSALFQTSSSNLRSHISYFAACLVSERRVTRRVQRLVGFCSQFIFGLFDRFLSSIGHLSSLFSVHLCNGKLGQVLCQKPVRSKTRENTAKKHFCVVFILCCIGQKLLMGMVTGPAPSSGGHFATCIFCYLCDG